jgi:hypothetical protein
MFIFFAAQINASEMISDMIAGVQNLHPTYFRKYEMSLLGGSNKLLKDPACQEKY